MFSVSIVLPLYIHSGNDMDSAIKQTEKRFGVDIDGDGKIG